MRYTEKLTENQQVKISKSLASGIKRMAKARGLDKNEWIREALATALLNQGGYLPPECPENFAHEWPEGSANHVADNLIRSSLNELEALVGDYAYERVPERFERVMATIRATGSKSLANYAREKFLDLRLTPLNRLHYVEERIFQMKFSRKAKDGDKTKAPDLALARPRKPSTENNPTISGENPPVPAKSRRAA